MFKKVQCEKVLLQFHIAIVYIFLIRSHICISQSKTVTMVTSVQPLRPTWLPCQQFHKQTIEKLANS